MTTTPKSFRLPAETTEKIKEMANLLRESEAAVLKRAVDMLYEKREEVFEQDTQKRREGLK